MPAPYRWVWPDNRTATSQAGIGRSVPGVHSMVVDFDHPLIRLSPNNDQKSEPTGNRPRRHDVVQARGAAGAPVVAWEARAFFERIESEGDSLFGGFVIHPLCWERRPASMVKSLSDDLRVRVVEAVEAGASRRQAGSLRQHRARLDRSNDAPFRPSHGGAAVPW